MRKYWPLPQLIIATLLLAGALSWYLDQVETRYWALEHTTGRVVWSRPAAPRDYAAAAGGGRVVSLELLRQFEGLRLVEFTALVGRDARSGWPLWAHRLADAELPRRGTVHYATASRVYLKSRDSLVITFDATTGKRLWHVANVVDLAPVGDDLMVSVAEGENRSSLKRLAGDDGAERWSAPLAASVDLYAYSFVGVFDSTAYALMLLRRDDDNPEFVTRYEYWLQAFDLESGEPRFLARYPADTFNIVGFPGGPDGQLQGNGLILSEPETGRELRRLTISYPQTNVNNVDILRVKFSGNTIYFKSLAMWADGPIEETHLVSAIHALDLVDGRERWRAPQEAVFRYGWSKESQAGMVADQEVLVFENALLRRLIALRLTDGQELWRWQTQPLLFSYTNYHIADGKVYFIDRAPRWQNWRRQLPGG